MSAVDEADCKSLRWTYANQSHVPVHNHLRDLRLYNGYDFKARRERDEIIIIIIIIYLLSCTVIIQACTITLQTERRTQEKEK